MIKHTSPIVIKHTSPIGGGIINPGSGFGIDGKPGSIGDGGTAEVWPELISGETDPGFINGTKETGIDGAGVI